jgi:hypothetical protein
LRTCKGRWINGPRLPDIQRRRFATELRLWEFSKNCFLDPLEFRTDEFTKNTSTVRPLLITNDHDQLWDSGFRSFELSIISILPECQVSGLPHLPPHTIYQSMVNINSSLREFLTQATATQFPLEYRISGPWDLMPCVLCDQRLRYTSTFGSSRLYKKHNTIPMECPVSRQQNLLPRVLRDQWSR